MVAVPSLLDAETKTATATQPADARPALSKFVTIEILNVPPQTKVFSALGRVGIAPGKLQLERGDEALSLTFEADGYQGKSGVVMVNAHGSFDVGGLKPDKRRKPAKGKGKGKKRPKRASEDSKNTIETFD